MGLDTLKPQTPGPQTPAFKSAEASMAAANNARAVSLGIEQSNIFKQAVEANARLKAAGENNYDGKGADQATVQIALDNAR